MTPASPPESILVLDIGETNTRALLFDVVDGQYRFIACGISVTTAASPLHDVGHGVRAAIDQLHEITGRVLIGEDERVVIPTRSDGAGVDAFTVIMSAGAPIKVIAAGLLNDVSVASVQRLAQTTYTEIIDTFHLNDRRKPEVRLNAIVRSRPDVILIAGGVENGSKQAVLKLIEPIGLACFLLPNDLKPLVLYAGNGALAREVEAILSPLTAFTITPNVRPVLEAEVLAPARVQMARAFRQVRLRQLPGLRELDNWAGGHIVPAATGLGRMIQFLSMEGDSQGVLGVEVSISAATLAVAFAGELSLGVYSDLGLGNYYRHLTSKEALRSITRWLYLDISDEEVREYAYNKALYLRSLPATPRELAIEQAIARYAINQAVERLRPTIAGRARIPGLLPTVEPIIATGNLLTQSPNLAHCCLMLLDALQPVGVTTLVVDQNNLISALGSIASLNPAMAVQIMDSASFSPLGVVVSPVSYARPGTTILRVHLQYEGGEEKVEIKQGSLQVLPLGMGRSASLHLKPLNGADIGLGPGRGARLNHVLGSALGLIIDARGRPLRLVQDAARRRNLFVKWLRALGG